MSEKALVLLSGGVDSSCAAMLAKEQGFELSGIHFLRPRKQFERDYAQKFADKLRIPLKVVECDLTALIREVQEVPLKYTTLTGAEWEFLLGRNFIYLTLAANHAISIGAKTIVVGFAPHDADPLDIPQKADYPDCHISILNGFAALLSSCIHSTLKPSVPSLNIWAPLVKRTNNKKDVFELALTLGIDLDDTITCYTPIAEKRPEGTVWVPCGTCLACLHKAQALKELQEET